MNLELHEFIKTALVDITKGVLEARKEIGENSTLINPAVMDKDKEIVHLMGVYRIGQSIHSRV